jgi:3-deoxy-D-manno-octulosonic-acid transferase
MPGIRICLPCRWGLLPDPKPLNLKSLGARGQASGDNRGALLLYRVLAAAALAAYAPYALLRSVAGGRRLGDLRGRFGFSKIPDLDGGIWIHAVSVGEIGVARNLLAALSRARPGMRAGVSVTTAAGRELAGRVFAAEAPVFAFPFDLVRPVERALLRARPGLVLLTETEIWPLFLERAARRGIPVALVNGRLSERSFRRYALARGFMRETLGRLSLMAMQSPEDARRALELGAPADRVHVTGNLKYDLPEPPPFPDARRLTEAAAGRAIIASGSTAEGEEEVVLDAWRGLAARPLLLLAPRRPERFETVARMCVARGLRVTRRSSPASAGTPAPDVYLLDSIGELAAAYRHALVAFVGGSLVPRGGQNPIEAWAAGAPVLAGPHMENFRDIAAAGQARGILERVTGTAALTRALAAALADPETARAQGGEAARFVAESRGAAERTAAAVLALLPAAAARGAAS